MIKRNKSIAFILSLSMLFSAIISSVVSAEYDYTYNDSSYFYKFYTCSVIWGNTARIGLNSNFAKYLKGQDSTGATLTDLTTPFVVSSDSDGNPTVLYHRGDPLPNIFSIPCNNANVTTAQLWYTFNSSINGSNAVKTLDFSLFAPSRDINVSLIYTFGDNSTITTLDMTPFGNEHINISDMNSTFIRMYYLTKITGLEKLKVTSNLKTMSNVFYGDSRLAQFDLSSWDLSGMTSIPIFNSTSSSVSSKPVKVYVKDTYAKKLCDAQNNKNLNFVIKENSLLLRDIGGKNVAKDYKDFIAEVSAAENTMSGVLVAAIYDNNGYMINCDVKDAAQNVPFSFDTDGRNAKVMWFESLQSIRPMAPESNLVRVACEDFTLNKSSILFESTATQTISSTAVPSNTTDFIYYTSSNPNVAAVDAYGKVTPVSDGDCVITASCRSLPEKTVNVTVDLVRPCTDLTLTSDTLTFTSSAVQKIGYATVPSNTTDKASFVSDNTAIATVDSTGNVTPVSDGECTITVTCGSVVKTINIIISMS